MPKKRESIDKEGPMLAERLPSVDDVVNSFEEGRHRLAEVDPIGASRSALRSAQDAIPEGWPGHRRPSRWPWVTALILGTTLVGLVLFLTPTFQRYMARARTFRDASTIPLPPPAADANAPADEASMLAQPAISDPFSTLPMEEPAG
jgi:hypothetical protein